MTWMPVKRMACDACQVLWNGTPDCWMCGEPGVCRSVVLTPVGAHTFEADRVEVVVAGEHVRI